MLLEELKGILAKNQNLSDDIKNNILSLCEIVVTEFPDINFDYLKKNLETLKIEKVSKYLSHQIAYYSGSTNTICINYSKITDDDDIKHIMMHQLLNVITYNGYFSGFNENNFLEALNVGFTEILTNNLVGNDGDVSYYDEEVIATNLLSSIVGFETLKNGYFSNNANMVLEGIIKAEGDL